MLIEFTKKTGMMKTSKAMAINDHFDHFDHLLKFLTF
jgi:hypothetical protein